MLQMTIQIASAKATSSSQLIGLPRAWKAGESAQASTASIGESMRRLREESAEGRLAGGPGASAPQRDEDLVRLDHAQFHARLLLDHLEAFAQVQQFGLQLR